MQFEASSHVVTVSHEGAGIPAGYVPPLLANGDLSLRVGPCGDLMPPMEEVPCEPMLREGRRYDRAQNCSLIPFGNYRLELEVDGRRLEAPERWAQSIDLLHGRIVCACTYAGGIEVQTEVCVPLEGPAAVLIRRTVKASGNVRQTLRLQMQREGNATAEPPLGLEPSALPEDRFPCGSAGLGFRVYGYRFFHLALAVAGRLDFNPATDALQDGSGHSVMLDEPHGNVFPPEGFDATDEGFVEPPADGSGVKVAISPDSDRLQKLAPFDPWDGKDLCDMPLLIKVKGKCTTDHISMAGPWLRYRGHLQNISDNLLMGAVNAFNDESNRVICLTDGTEKTVSAAAKAYKAAGLASVVVAEDNYGEGSSREHAAMEPRYLNVRVVLAKSFARIHETNLKKQGMLALTFADKDDYDKVREDDRISVTGLGSFEPGKPLTVTLRHADGTTDTFEACHSYNSTQIEWFRAGSALNYVGRHR